MLCKGTQTYVKPLISNYEKLFGELPHPIYLALTENDHPELDSSLLCGPDNIACHQLLIGACQWMISLVHFDLTKPIMLFPAFAMP